MFNEMLGFGSLLSIILGGFSRLRRALARVDAGPNGSNTVFWTSLREEPVLYVNGRPHVLRQVDRPLQNME